MSFDFLKIEEGKFVLSVHPPCGSAVYSSKTITRETPRTEITESEIENAISQAIWKLFDEDRMLFQKIGCFGDGCIDGGCPRPLYKLDGAEWLTPSVLPQRT